MLKPTSLRAKVEQAFRVIKCQIRFGNVYYQGIKKNNHKLKTLFAVANQWMTHKQRT